MHADVMNGTWSAPSGRPRASRERPVPFVHSPVPFATRPVRAFTRVVYASGGFTRARMTQLDGNTETHAAERADRFPLTSRELLSIFAFWIFLGALAATNRLLDPRGPRFQAELTSPVVLFAFAEPVLWALLTPVVVWLSSRYSMERRDRLRSIVVFAAAGIALATFVGLAMEQLRDAVFDPSIGVGPRRRGGGGGGGPPSLWTFGRLRILNNLLIYIAVLAAAQARTYSLRYRARKEDAVRLRAESAQLEAQLAEARLDALRRQLDPHFLFNTLHAISSLVERDPRGVRRMISRLSELLRHSIEGANEQEIPLRRELDLLQRYVEIMQVRFQGRLQVETHVPGELLDAMVPNLVLQPIVENAIKHGVSKIEEAGRIEISAERSGGALLLRVRDNGPGPGSDRAVPVDEEGGLGLRNTRERLQQLYDDQQHFTIRAADGGGTIAEIELPFHTYAEIRAAAPRSATAG
jgi:two-component system, LytTR family, sensor kinase